MTRKELELLKIEKSPLNLNVEAQLVTWDYSSGVLNEKLDSDNDYCVKIGRAKYYNFYEAQALLNDLEKHIQ